MKFLIKNITKGNLFWKTFFSYMLIVVIFLFVLFGVFNWMYDSLQKEQVENANQMIEQFKIVIDTNIENVINAAESISSDNEVESFSSSIEGSSSEKYIKARQISMNIPNYANTNDLIAENIIFYNNKNVVIRPDNASLRVEEFYKSVLNFEGYTYEEWNDKVINYGTKPRFVKLISNLNNTQKVEYISYIRYFPVNSLYSAYGAIIMCIDTKSLMKKVQVQLLGENASFVIVDEKNEILATQNYNESYYQAYQNGNNNEEEIYIIENESLITPWKYVLFVSQNDLMNKTQEMKRFFIILMGISLIIGLGIVLVNAYNSTRPIKEIIEILGKGSLKSRSGNEYLTIKESVSQLVNRNQILREDMKEQMIKLKESFLTQLFFGTFKSSLSIEEYLRHIELEHILEKEYVMVVCEIQNRTLGNDESYKEDEELRVFVMRVINEFKSLKGYVQCLDNNIIAILISCDNSTTNEFINDELNKLVEKLAKETKINIYFAIGNRFSNLMYAYVSYLNAISMLNNTNQIRKDNVLWYKSGFVLQDQYYYPIEIESKLIALIKMGEKNQAIDLFNEIKEKNRAISSMNATVFVTEIKGTLMKVSFQLYNETKDRKILIDKIKYAYKTSTYEDLMIGIENIIAEMSNYVEKTRNNKNVELRSQILEYLDEYYMDENLTLVSLSEELGFAEKYISRFFKEQTKQTFTSYVESLRMEKAIDLIKNTDMTFLAISKKVGYTSQNTFYKAFKRNYLVSPGEYRCEFLSGNDK